MKRKYEEPSIKIVELRQRARLLDGSGGQGNMQSLQSFDNGGDPLAGE